MPAVTAPTPLPPGLPPAPAAAVRRRLLRESLVLLALATAGPARALLPPRGKVVLTVRGRVAAPNAGDRADFDMAMLEALPQHSFSTGTPWFKTVRRFSGPLLRDVLDAAGASGETLRAVALNDYRIEIPMRDTRAHKMLLATRLDGAPMAVRDKGPLFIVYPYDDDPALRNERYYSRSAWQLRTLEVR